MLRNLALGTFAAVAAFWSYYFWDSSTDQRRQLEQRDGRIADLETEVSVKAREIATQAREIEQLLLAKELLRLDHRIATMEVIRQGPPLDGSGGVETEVLFTELDSNGDPIGTGESIVIPGKRIYIEGLVVKFEDSYVEQGDHLRGTSVCLFERVFSEELAPDEGIVIDAKNRHPLPFQGDNLPDPLYGELFDKIWEYANDPEKAAKLGVRAIHGEAPFVEAKAGKTYRIELRQSDGLSITAER